MLKVGRVIRHIPLIAIQSLPLFTLHLFQWFLHLLHSLINSLAPMPLSPHFPSTISMPSSKTPHPTPIFCCHAGSARLTKTIAYEILPSKRVAFAARTRKKIMPSQFVKGQWWLSFVWTAVTQFAEGGRAVCLRARYRRRNRKSTRMSFVCVLT